MTENWQIFNKDHEPHDGIKNLPEPPPWRSFNTEVQTTEKKSRALWRSFNNEVQTTEKKSREEIKGKTFQVWDPKNFEKFKSFARKKALQSRSTLKWDNN